MTGMRVQPDDGPPVTFLTGGSRLTDEEEPVALLGEAVRRLRQSNGASPARPKSYAITQVQDAILWLEAFAEGKIR